MNAQNQTDLSNMHMPTTMAGVTARGGLNISFGYVQVAITNDGDADLNGKIETRLVVHKTPIGDRATGVSRFITEAEAAKRYPEQYAAFKEYGDVPMYGTALKELPGITQSQIALMTLNGINSVEDLADVPMEAISGMGLEARRAQNIATQWLATKEGASKDVDIAGRLAALETERETRQKREADLSDENKQLRAQIEAMKSMVGSQSTQAPQGTAAIMPSQMQSDAIMVDSGEDFPEETHDPFTDGPEIGGDLDMSDPDPLAGG